MDEVKLWYETSVLISMVWLVVLLILVFMNDSHDGTCVLSGETALHK
jgi:hypothetical protein